jgi:DNA-binding NtrC family response regulator
MPHRKPAASESPDKKGESACGRPEDRPCQKKIGVLVADDDHLVRVLLQLGLERHGFEVWLAPNGKDAIELCREHGPRIAVVLLEVHLPDLNGPATLTGLRQHNPELRACFMRSDVAVGEVPVLLECGALPVIAKPFLLDDLVNILRRTACGELPEIHPKARSEVGEIAGQL